MDDDDHWQTSSSSLPKQQISKAKHLSSEQTAAAVSSFTFVFLI
jgi:hypothetical protein